MTLPLTERQEQLWRYIKSCARSPSFQQMADALGTVSKGEVHRLLAQLEKRGFIKRAKNTARSVVALEAVPAGEVRYTPPQPSPHAIWIPLRGRIS